MPAAICIVHTYKKLNFTGVNYVHWMVDEAIIVLTPYNALSAEPKRAQVAHVAIKPGLGVSKFCDQISSISIIYQ